MISPGAHDQFYAMAVGCTFGVLASGFYVGHLTAEFFLAGVILMLLCNWLAMRALKVQHERHMREYAEATAMMMAARYELEDLG